MKRVGALRLGDETVFVEVDDVPIEVVGEDAHADTAGTPVFRGGESSSKGDVEADRFTQALERIKPVAERVVETFRRMNAPEELSIEFGIKFNTRVGAFLASADSEAAFKVSLKWKNQPPDAQAPRT